MFFYLIFSILILIALFCAYQMSAIDLKRRIIPDVYLFPFLLIGLILPVFFGDIWPITIMDSVLAGTFGYLLTILTGFVFSKTVKKNKDITPIGFGDVKLLAAGGIWLGTSVFPIALIIACVIARIWGTRKKQDFVPFAPFFIFGSIIAFIIFTFLI